MRTQFVIIFTILLAMFVRMGIASSQVSTSHQQVGEGQLAPCDQQVYDALYETLLRETIRTGNYENKIETVELLKHLCHNQRFTLEKKNIGARRRNGLPVPE